jgi:hypothetical protein
MSLKSTGKQDTIPLVAYFCQASECSCAYCNKEGHFLSKCTIVSCPESRKVTLHRNNRCFIYLDKGLMARNCTSSCVCYACIAMFIASLHTLNHHRQTVCQVELGFLCCRILQDQSKPLWYNYGSCARLLAHNRFIVLINF